MLQKQLKMKKEYLDVLYEKRSEIQSLIDDLKYKVDNPIDDSAMGLNLQATNEAELKIMRMRIFDINNLIESYLTIHGK